MRVQTLWLPKAGHAADEYEDAFGASDAASLPFRAVVADGATESAFSGGWARLLAAEYLRLGALVEAAASARALFNPEVSGRWYVQAKAAEGAHAALLGFELEAGRPDEHGASGMVGRPGKADKADSPGNPGRPYNAGKAYKRGKPGEGAGTWRAESVGDCCLFHVRGGHLHASWPYADAGDFHHCPHLISSLESPLDVLAASGTWQEGDAFILATDALAAWLLEAGVEALLESEDFGGLVAAARRDTAGGTHGATEASDVPGATASAGEATISGETASWGENGAPGRPSDTARPRLRDDDTTAVIIRL